MKASSALVRVTVHGNQRAADLTIPLDTPVGLLLPSLVEKTCALGRGVPQAFVLVSAAGVALHDDQTLDAIDALDGDVLLLVPASDVPPRARIYDVTGWTKQDRPRLDSQRRDLRLWCALALLVVSGSWSLTQNLSSHAAGPVWAFGLGLALLGSVAQRSRQVGLAAWAVGAMMALTAVWCWGRPPLALDHVWLTVGTACWSLLALAVLFGAWQGAMLAVVSCAAMVAVRVALVGHAPSAIINAVPMLLGVAILGLLPRLALSLAGLTRISENESRGSSTSRAGVATAVQNAHQTLGIPVLTVCTMMAWCAWQWAPRGGYSPAAFLLLVAAVTLLRVRAFPNILEWAVLSCAALSIAMHGLSLFPHSHAWNLVWVPVALAALFVIKLLVPPVQAPLAARFRQVADVLEGLAVLALVPTLLACIEAYQRLLHQAS